MADAELVIRAKNAAKQALEDASRDMQKFKEDFKDGASAVDGASKVIRKALSGDIVGACKDAIKMVGDLGKQLASNPFATIATGAGLAAVAVYKLAQAYKASRDELHNLAQDQQSFTSTLDEIINGPLSERHKAEAAELVAAGDEKELRRRLLAAKIEVDSQEGEARYQQARYAEAVQTKADMWWVPGFIENAAEGLGGNPAQEYKALRDQAVAELRTAVADVKTYQDALAQLEANRAKAADEEAKRIDDADKARQRAANAEAKRTAAQEAADKAAAEKKLQANERELEAAQRQLAAAEQRKQEAAEQARMESLKAEQDRAAESVKARNEELQAARDTWTSRGISGFAARRAARQAEAAADRDERQLQRQLARYEAGARDKPAMAARSLQEARDFAALANDDAKRAAAALKAEQDRREAEKIEALQKTAAQAAATVEELQALHEALVG